MKINQPILGGLLAVIFILSCKESPSKKSADTAKETNELVSAESDRKTYAEISVKEGGEWQGTKYVGENLTFKNLEYLKAPDSLTDHSYYVRYEGPGWESNKVGYRLYFDWRNAIDIFGKKVDTMVLSKVGRDNYDSYHEDSPWGMDILKAGSSLGIGSYGRYDGVSSVAHFKDVKSRDVAVSNSEKGSGVTLNYNGWTANEETIDLKTDLFIEPDSRITKVTLNPSKAVNGLCTGIVKFEDVELLQKDSDNGEWAYIATYGEQTLVPDQLGMVIFYKKSDVEKVTEADHDHIIVFKPTANAIAYHFAAAWEKEKEGISTKEEFLAYIDEALNQF